MVERIACRTVLSLVMGLVVACSPPPDATRLDLPLPEDVDLSHRAAGRYGGGRRSSRGSDVAASIDAIGWEVLLVRVHGR